MKCAAGGIDHRITWYGPSHAQRMSGDQMREHCLVMKLKRFAARYLLDLRLPSARVRRHVAIPA
jgi:hypothetical protein